MGSRAVITVVSQGGLQAVQYCPDGLEPGKGGDLEDERPPMGDDPVPDSMTLADLVCPLELSSLEQGTH